MLRKHAWKALLLVAVGIAAGYGFGRVPPAAFANVPIFSKAPPPSAYQSLFSLILNAGEFTGSVPYVEGALQRSGVTPALTTLASTYTEYLQSNAFAGQVIAKLGLHADPVVVSKSISTRLVANTNVLVVTVRWTSPDESQRMAETVASLFINGTGTSSPSGSDITRSSLLAALNAQAEDDKRQMTALQQQIAGINQNPVLTAADRSAEVAPLQQQLIGLQSNYSSILNSLANDGAGLIADLKPAQVLDVAQLGQKTPKTWVSMLLGALAGSALGIGLMCLLQYLDVTVDSPSGLAAALAAPVLGTVGMVRNRSWVSPGWRDMEATAKGSVDPDVITIRRPTAGTSEAFRLLRTLLQLGSGGPSPRTLLVTSGAVGEGKTIVAANLAVATAQRGKRVVLVDADLHRPNIHRLFNLQNDHGLTDLLRLNGGSEMLEESGFLHPVPDVPNLWVVPTGPAPLQPPELLGSPQATEILSMLSRLADIVIYDTGPATCVADALALATQVDGVIVVARSMQSRLDAVQHLSDRLRLVGAHVLGGVLNAVPGDGLHSYSSGQYGRGSVRFDDAPEGLLSGRAATVERA